MTSSQKCPPTPTSTGYINNYRTQSSTFSNQSVSQDARRTPIRRHQSKRLRHMQGAWNKSKEEEPLELVDVIDIEDEDHSFSAFFVGMNNNALPSASQASSHHNQRVRNNNSNNHQANYQPAAQPPMHYPSSNKLSYNLNTTNAPPRHNTPGGTTSLPNQISTNPTPTTATIINAVNTINISNSQYKRSLVIKLRYHNNCYTGKSRTQTELL